MAKSVLFANRRGALLTKCFLVAGIIGAFGRTIAWHDSREDVIVFNVDGSFQADETHRVGFGGVRRNGDGVWLVGFAGSIGGVDCLCAEFMAIDMEGPLFGMASWS